MREKISKLTEKFEESHRSDLSDAFNRLADEVDSRESYPGQIHIDHLLDGSIADLEESGEEEEAVDRFLSKKWGELAEELEEWEDEHPGVTLIIGHIARALAAAGL